MKNTVFSSKIIIFFLMALSANITAQTERSIAFGQCLDSTLATQSSTITYLTPNLYPGDVALIRLKESGAKLKFEFLTPSGIPVESRSGTSTADLLQMIYRLPVGIESGRYKIIVSGISSKGNFFIAIDRMNAPTQSSFLECNTALAGTLGCGPIIRSFRYAVQKDTRSRVKVSPIGTALEVWLCNELGTIIKHEAKSLGEEVVFDTILANRTACYYVFIGSSNAFFATDFNVSHTILSGTCSAPLLSTNMNNEAICENQLLSFNLIPASEPGFSYRWQGPNGFSSDQPNISFITEQKHAGIYTLTIQPPEGLCAYVYHRLVIINPLPTATATTIPITGQTCVGQSFGFDVTSNPPALSYQWKGPDNYSSTLKSPVINNATIAKSGTYTVTVTDSKGCKNASAADMVVHALPTANMVSGPACMNTTLTLNAETNAQNAQYQWEGPNGFESTQHNPNIADATSANSGYYYLTITDAASGCSFSVSKFISINFPPTVSLTSDETICTGENITLQSFTDGTYRWSNGLTTAVITVNPVETTTYTVTVTNKQTGCTGSKDVTVTVNALPSVSIVSTPANPEICSGNGNILLCGTSNAQNPAYQWTKSGFSNNQQCVSVNAPAQSGIYTFKATDGATGCANTAALSVTIHPTPTVSFLQVPEGPTHCAGTAFTLCANSTATQPDIQWTAPNNTSASSLCLSVNNASTLQAGNYSVTITDLYGCRVNSSIAIDIPPTPVAGITGDLSICENDRTTLTASGGGNYKWSTGSGLATINPNPSATTTYSVIVTNTFGCKDTAWATITVNLNNLKLSATVNNNNLQAKASGGTAPYTYTLSPPTQPSNQDGSFPNLPNGTYTIFVSDATGCAILQPVSVQIVNDEEPLKIGRLSVSPNPTSGPFTISWNGPPSGFLITIYDMSGRLISMHQGDSTVANVDLSGATSGVYAILLTTPKFSARGKVVIR